VEAPLYTVYVPKKMEFRVHVFKGNDASFIVDIQRKIKKPDAEVKDWKIRNLDNGFIYARNGVEEIVPEDVRVQARCAFDLSGLDFGAVDVIFNEGQGRAYVLEINTAPGISGTTVENYADAFRKLVA
jgi:D-alanine-D-alanine ligase-like ATP-grasp enzyme